VHEVRAGQLLQDPAAVAAVAAVAAAVAVFAGSRGEGGCRITIDVSSRVKAKQPERTCGGGGQVPVGPGEYASDGSPGVPVGIKQ
jgi:hypothetical protein